MLHRDKVAQALADLKQRGAKIAVAPIDFRLAWKLGLKVPPPHFLSSRALTVYSIVWAIIAAGIFAPYSRWLMTLYVRMHLIPAQEYKDPGTACWIAVGIIIGAGMGLMGFLMYHWDKSRLKLPSWEAYGGTAKP